MSIIKLKNSRFLQFDFTIKGHRFYGSTKRTNEREAREVEKAERAAAQRQVEESIRSGRKPMTLGVACARWWDEVGRHGQDPDIQRALELLKERIGAEVALHDVTDDVVSKATQARRRDVMRAGLDSQGKQLFRPLSPRTINKTVPSLLRRVMNRAKRAWSVTFFNEINWKDHFLDEIKRDIREITTEEDARLDEVESREYAELREFAEIMGLRRRALLLTWPQVNLKDGTIRVKLKRRKGYIWQTLPLSRRAYAIVWAQRGNDPLHVFTFVAARTRRCPKTGTEFVRGVRYPMTYYGIGTNWRRMRVKAGVADARMHDLRHTAGQRTLRATGNLRLTQTLLGHSEITTTVRFYTETNLTDLREGLNRTESQRKAHTQAITIDNPLKDKA